MSVLPGIFPFLILCNLGGKYVPFYRFESLNKSCQIKIKRGNLLLGAFGRKGCWLVGTTVFMPRTGQEILDLCLITVLYSQCYWCKSYIS